MLLIPLTEEGRKMLEEAEAKADPLGLGVPVRFIWFHGEGVISDHYRGFVKVSWFNPCTQQVNHRWADRTDVEVLATKTTASA